MPAPVLKVKNWEELQHYKDRTPPWIKLYNTVLDDYEFSKLTDKERYHLIGIWMLASRTENKIPFDATWIGQRLYATDTVDLDRLIELGFLYVHGAEHNASTPLASCTDAALASCTNERTQSRGEQSRLSSYPERGNGQEYVDTETGEIRNA